MGKARDLVLGLRNTSHSDRTLVAALSRVLPSLPSRLVGLLCRVHSNQVVEALACLAGHHDRARILLAVCRNHLVDHTLHDLFLVRTLVAVLRSGLSSWFHQNFVVP